MAYKFQDGPFSSDGPITGSTTITAVAFLGDGSALQNVTGSGGGDFSGPGSSTDNAIVRFDGTGGKTAQNSGITIADSTNNLAGAGSISGSGRIDGFGLRLDTNGIIGTAADTDLLTLTTNQLTIAGGVSGSGITKLVGAAQFGSSIAASGSISSKGTLSGSGDLTLATAIDIDGSEVLSKATLGSTVLASSLTSVGTLTALTVDGTVNLGAGSDTINIGANASDAVTLGHAEGSLESAGMHFFESGQILATLMTGSTTNSVSAGSCVVLCSGSAAMNVKLPTISNMGQGASDRGYPLYIKRARGTGSLGMQHDITISCSAADTIDGDTTIVLESANASVLLVGTGSVWYVF